MIRNKENNNQSGNYTTYSMNGCPRVNQKMSVVNLVFPQLSCKAKYHSSVQSYVFFFYKIAPKHQQLQRKKQLPLPTPEEKLAVVDGDFQYSTILKGFQG